MKNKFKFLYQGAGDGVHYFQCNICKDVFSEGDDFIEHIQKKCEKPLTKKQGIKILKKCLEKAIKNGYEIKN